MTSEAKQPGRFKAWLQLLRVPNLLTVPLDPIIGFWFVSLGFKNIQYQYMAAAVLICLLIYAAGLIHNSLCRLKEDRIYAPNRPLVNGTVSVRSAWIVVICLLVLAFGVTWGISGNRVARVGEAFDGVSSGQSIYNNLPLMMIVLGNVVYCLVIYNCWLRKKPSGRRAMVTARASSVAFGGMVAGGGAVFERQFIAMWVLVFLWGSAMVFLQNWVPKSSPPNEEPVPIEKLFE